MLQVLRYIIPFIDTSVRHWALSARILRWFTFLWLSIGLVALYSASYPVGDVGYGDGLYYFKRQLAWALLGFIGFNIVTKSPLDNLWKISHWVFFIVLGLIVLTHVPGLGITINGATRWLKVGPAVIQPSELIKPFLVLQSARLFGQWERLTWWVRLGWLLLFGAVLASILLQPNLSTTALCGMSLWLIALAGGLPLAYLGTTAIAGLLVGTLSITINEYQQRRITSFLDPWADPRGDGYQLVQSLLAIGSGGTWGAGYGLSQQKQFFLPIQYTDFIFSVFAEEFGFVGSVTLLLLLIAYGTMALLVAMKCRHPVKRLVAMGSMVFLVGQSLLNIGVAAGGLPTTGLPFPLLSYGGSSIIASLFLAALLIRVARESNEAKVISLHSQK